ncbi:hypothetical protein CVT24_012843 [Panaeolus cyanescens]|uniref:Uncharacterized protein n=1 Tax=Panaeolus cyanescens TaxID=181874 RepID=A0A409W6I0_9AGAR|nr:hypothetical protein CVT24_012843 [Panaeolus cyanescens]
MSFESDPADGYFDNADVVGDEQYDTTFHDDEDADEDEDEAEGNDIGDAHSHGVADLDEFGPVHADSVALDSSLDGPLTTGLNHVVSVTPLQVVHDELVEIVNDTRNLVLNSTRPSVEDVVDEDDEVGFSRGGSSSVVFDAGDDVDDDEDDGFDDDDEEVGPAGGGEDDGLEF